MEVATVLYIVGIGPGSRKQMTIAAHEAISASEVIVGYKVYVDLLGEMAKGKEIISTPMTREVERASKAIDIACSGRSVAVVSSGDSGIYGMAGLVFELLADRGWRPGASPKVEVIAGISALSSAGAALGAPLMHDFAVISLSDLLTPWELIKKRIEAAAMADFVIVLYNPASKKRVNQIKECREILLRYRSSETPAGIVTNCGRDGEAVSVSTLERMLDNPITMTTTLIIGNSESFRLENLLITPRGYKI